MFLHMVIREHFRNFIINVINETTGKSSNGQYKNVDYMV